MVKLRHRIDKVAYTDNVSCSSLGSEHTENACSTANIEHGLSFEQMSVVDDRGTI